MVENFEIRGGLHALNNADITDGQILSLTKLRNILKKWSGIAHNETLIRYCRALGEAGYLEEATPPAQLLHKSDFFFKFHRLPAAL
jgi:hypothetical protein